MLPNSSMKSKQKDLQHAQSLQVRKMLNLNKTQDVNKEEISVWKIIVYDRYCQDILSTLFKVFQKIFINYMNFLSTGGSS